MNKERSSGISAVVGIVILILLVLVLSAGVLFAAQTLIGDQPQQMVGGMTEERVSPYEQRVSLVSQGNADDLTIVSPLGTEYNLSQVGDSQLYLAVSPSVSGAQDPQILGVKNGERQVLASSEIRDGIPADIIVDKHGTGDYSSIQNALNNTQEGDIIVIEKATYNENIDVPPNVSLIAEHGTVLQDQNPAEPVISINNGNATIMNFIINADPTSGDNHYASHGILVKGRNTEVIGNTILNATSPTGDSAGLRVEKEGVVARYNNFKNNDFSLSVSNDVGSVQLCSNQLDGGLHGSFSKSTYETFVMRNYWNKGVPSTVLNNVLSDRPNVTATDVSRNAVIFNKVFETSNDQEILAAKAFPGTRLFGGAPCGIQLSFTNQGSSVNVVNASISYEIKNVTYNVTFNEDNTATLIRGNNSTTTSYSVSGGDTSWDTGESLTLDSPDSGSSDTSGVWSSGSGSSGGASFWGGGTGGGLSGGSLFGGGGGSFWGVSSGTTSSDVKVTKSPTNNTTASVEQSPPENVTETEKQNVTVDLGADFKATVGDEISLDAVVTGGTSPYNYTWKLGDGTTSYSKSVTHIYDSTGNYTILLNVTDSETQSDTDSITVWIKETTTTTKTKNETLTLNEQVNNLSAGETLVIPSGSYSSVNVNVPGVTIVGDGSVTINGLSILSDNVKIKNVEVSGPLSVTGSDFSMYDSIIDNTGGTWAIEVYETGAYFSGVTGEANNGMYIAKGLQDIQFTGGSLTANSGQGALVKKHTGIVEVTDSSITTTGAGIYREHSSQLYLTRNSISGSPDIERKLNKPPQPAFTYNSAPLDSGGYGVKFDPSPTTDPEGEPITSMKWDFDNDGVIDAYGDGVKQYTYPDYGTYNVTLSVTDYHGVTVNYKREITINEYYFAVSVNKSTSNVTETIEFNKTTSVPDNNIEHYNMDYDGDGTAEEQVNSLPATYTYTTAGNYSPQIELVTTNSGTLVNSTSVKVLAPPTATFTTNTSLTNPNEKVEFNASASTDPDGGALSYEWNFGDGAIATGETLTHSYSNTGDYTISLTVTDDEGETNTTTKTISVTEPGPSLTNGLVAHWTMDDSDVSGNTLIDVAGSHNGTITGAPQTGVTGVSGQAFRFDGNDDWISVPHESSLNPGDGGWSISVWVASSDPDAGGSSYFVNKNYHNGYSLRTLRTGTGIRYHLHDNSNSLEGEYDPGSSFWDGSWHHIVGTYDGSQVTIYIDGTKVENNSKSLGNIGETSELEIGRRGAAGDYLYGKMDEVRLYNRILSKSEVKSLYDKGSTPTANFTYSPPQPTTSDTISFDASTSYDADGSVTTYEWDLNGDGTVDATGETVSHSYSSSGDKTVTLTVTDDNGATNSTTKTISVTEFTAKALTWSTAADWDTAVSESGVVHENIANTDHNNAGVVKIGYSNSAQDSNLVAYYPLQENSGGVAVDVANYNNGTTTGATLNQPGILGTTGYKFDGSGDYITLPDLTSQLDPPVVTFTAWVKANYTGSRGGIISGVTSAYDRQGAMFLRDSGNLAYYDGDAASKESNLYVTDGDWHFVAVAVDGSTIHYYKDDETDTKSGGSTWSGDVTWMIGQRDAGSWALNGKLANVRAYSDALSKSEITTMYNVVNKTSTLTTNSKSFQNPVKPDLTNVSSTMKTGESLNITVIGSPDTSNEETHTVTLDGSNSYDLTWASAHSKYRVKISMETNNVTTTPSVNSISLKPIDNFAPSAEYTYSPSQPTDSDTISFNASNSSDTDGSISSYEWDFNNDGTTDATGVSPNHSYSSPGTYPVTVTVIDNNGASNSVTQNINVTSNINFRDTFEGGSNEGWNILATSVTDSYSYEGSYSLGGGGAGQHSEVIATKTVYDNGEKPNTLSYYWKEAQVSSGGGLRVKNTDGQYEMGMATDNPTWILTDGDGTTEVYNPGSNYGDWHYVKIEFDWANNQYHYRIENLADGPTKTGWRSLRHGKNIKTITIENYHTNQGGWSGGADFKMWFDDIKGQ